MYQIEGSRQVLAGGGRPGFRRLRWPMVSSSVVLLGLNSFFTDISSEMVATILPLYLLFSLHLAPVQLGIIDGLYQGGSVLVRVGSGLVADRWRRPKEVAAVGYGLSAATKLGLVAIQGPWLALTGLIMIDRIGKGIRTAPRNSIISLSSPPDRLGTAFGVHRALDTAGAMLGPLVAFGLLILLPDAFDAVFVVSFFFAILGLGLLVLFVRNPPGQTAGAARGVSVRAAVGLLRAPDFRMVVVLGSLLAVATVSDSFIYLALQNQLQFNLGYFPLLFVATALVYMVLALPLGRLADRVGRGTVFLAGYVLLALTYVSLLLPLGAAQVPVVILLLGTYYAMTDGVLMALASGLIPPAMRASGLGLLASATGLGRLVASVAFGVVWSVFGIQVAIACFLAVLVAGWGIAAFLMVRAKLGLRHV